jgi:pimeloyl-ACP methyl ester carboxylesterase
MGARHSDRLDALVLADSVGARPGANWFKLLLGRSRDAITREAGQTTPLGQHLLRRPRNFLHHAFRLASDTEPLKLAPRIRAPTLLAWGRRDHTFPPACAERLAAPIPDSRIAWSNASHDWLITHPREFASAVASFAREIGLLAEESLDAVGDDRELAVVTTS